MRSHTITLALADARVADLQRAATHHAAIRPPRRHRSVLVFLALAVTAAVIALAPSGVLAQPTHDVGLTTNPNVAQDLRSPDARDAADGRGTFNSPEVIVVKSQPQTPPVVGDRLDWADVGIGAGGLFAVGLLALGGGLFVTHRRRSTHTTAPAGL